MYDHYIHYTREEEKNKNLLTFIPLFRKKIEPKSWPENKNIKCSE